MDYITLMEQASLDTLQAKITAWLERYHHLSVETPDEADHSLQHLIITADPDRLARRISWAEAERLWYVLTTLKNQPLMHGGTLPLEVARRCGLDNHGRRAESLEAAPPGDGEEYHEPLEVTKENVLEAPWNEW